MPCHDITTPGGLPGVLCTRGPRPRCHACNSAAVVLCDYPVTERRTCDRPCCRGHAKPIGDRADGVDYCVPHALDHARAARGR